MLTTLRPALLQVAPARDTISIAADVASIVIAVAVLVVVALTGALFVRINRILGEMRVGVRQNLGPVSDRARSISENVEFITRIVRSDVESLDASVRALGARLTLASDRMEERIEEFNALIEVVQGEAEDIFLDTASTVRGVREGARSITSGRRRRDPGSGPGGSTVRPDAHEPSADGADSEATLAATDEGDGPQNGDR
jgi:hypothetical protein